MVFNVWSMKTVSHNSTSKNLICIWKRIYVSWTWLFWEMLYNYCCYFGIYVAYDLAKEQRVNFGDDIVALLRIVRKRRWTCYEEKRIQQEIELQQDLNILLTAEKDRSAFYLLNSVTVKFIVLADYCKKKFCQNCIYSVFIWRRMCLRNGVWWWCCVLITCLLCYV